MIVSLGLFSIVVTIAVGALLVLIASNERLQEEQSVMTNLSFALDSMTREIRTGTRYYCASRPNYSAGGPEAIFDASDNPNTLGDATRDCANGNNSNHRLHGIAFLEGGESITGAPDSRIVYFFDEDEGKIFRRAGNTPPQSIVSSGIFIMNAEFFVTGSNPLSSSELDQSAVTIAIEAKETGTSDESSYHIQTTVTQRTLDI